MWSTPFAQEEEWPTVWTPEGRGTRVELQGPGAIWTNSSYRGHEGTEHDPVAPRCPWKRPLLQNDRFYGKRARQRHLRRKTGCVQVWTWHTNTKKWFKWEKSHSSASKADWKHNSQHNSRWYPPPKKALQSSLPFYLTLFYHVHHNKKRVHPHLTWNQEGFRSFLTSKSHLQTINMKKNFILTQQQRGDGHWPANSQSIWLPDFMVIWLCSQQFPLQPHLKAHPALLHPMGEPAAWPQQGELSPEPRLARGSIRTHLEVQVRAIWVIDKETQGVKSNTPLGVSPDKIKTSNS